MKTSTVIRKSLREIQRIHEKLGDDYLAHCDASGVEPMPVVWHTFPPCPEGQTQAYLIYDYPDEWDQEGVDILCDDRSELAHKVFLEVMTRRLAQAN
jgi:hypothetical protein